MIRRRVLAAAAACALALAAPAAAHETVHEVRRGNAVAVRAYFAGGDPLAYAAYEVYSPADPAIPHQKGRTDRAGWLAFVPDAAGKWRVKVIDAGGHGLDVLVDVAPEGAAAASQGAPSTAAFVLRPLVGLAALAAIFAALVVAYRRKGPAR